MGRARVSHARTELVPESSNRSLKPVVYPATDDADGVVAIVGLVYAVQRSLGRFA
jgi:hypothetical protein